MTPTKHTMSVLAQITSWIPDRIIENLAKSTESRPGRKVYDSLSKQYPDFLTSSRNYPGLLHRFRKRTIRAVDSTTIQLTAFSMGWAKHRRQKAAAKMHTALNMRSFLPNFVIVKSAPDSDPKCAWEPCADMKAGEVVVFDKAYNAVSCPMNASG